MMEKTKDTVAQNGHPFDVAQDRLTPITATAFLEAEAKTRVTECQAEVQKVLDKYRCTLDVAVILRANQVIPQVQIISK